MRTVLVMTLLCAMTAGAASGAAAQGQSPPTSTTRPLSASGATIFLGGVPTGTRTETPLSITVVDAIDRALAHNLGVLMADSDVEHARGTRWKELAALLPNLNARVSEARQLNNLQAFGFSSDLLPGIPTLVGPFNTFDARIFLSQSVIDLAAKHNAAAEAHNVEAARRTYQGARDFVVWLTGNLYLQTLAASARVDSAKAQQQTAQALYTQAVDLRQNGIIAGIDVLRSQVQLNVETNRATSVASDFEKAKLMLARVMGLPLGQEYTLDSRLPDLPDPDLTLDQAVDRAYQARADYQAALERVRAAEATRQSIIGERLPALKLNADVGKLGLSPGDSLGTFSVSGAVQIPIYQGGRTRGRLLEADADLHKRQNEVEDLKASIYYEVRTAFLDVRTTNDELQVATQARDLAAQQLTQARDRFAAGLVSNIEVIQAQEAVAVANEQYTSALYGYGLAKTALIRGVGTAESTLRQYLGGTR